jgi:hypothetical protein
MESLLDSVILIDHLNGIEKATEGILQVLFLNDRQFQL